MRELTLAEWQDDLAKLDVCYGRVNTLPEGKWATAINFLDYGDLDVMMVTGRFGLKSYSLEDPANPNLAYIVWERDKVNGSDTFFSRTTDGGQTWGELVFDAALIAQTFAACGLRNVTTRPLPPEANVRGPALMIASATRLRSGY